MPEQPKALTDAVTPQEVEDVMKRVFGEAGLEAGAETPPAEPPPTEPPAGTPEEKPKEAPAPAPEATPAGEITPAAASSYVMVGEKRYTADDIIELERGALRQQDYTERTQLLTERQRVNEERATLLAEREAIADRFVAGEERPGEKPEGEEDLDPVEKRLLANERRLHDVEERVAEERQSRVDDRVMGQFHETVNRLHEHYKVKPGMRRSINATILDLNPAVAYDDGTPFPAVIIERNVTQAFLEAYQPVAKAIEETRQEVMQGLRAVPKTPTAPPIGGGPAPLVRPAPPKVPGEWDTHRNALEVIERLSEAGFNREG